MKKYSFLKIKDSKAEETDDFIAEEITLSVDVSNKEIVQLLCTPQNLKELSIGYLFTSGIISNINDIKSINILPILGESLLANVELTDAHKLDELKFKMVQATGCGKGNVMMNENAVFGKITSGIKIKSSVIISLMKEFQKTSENYKLTRGVHTAAIVDGSRIIECMDDIGRHNAVDKVIGKYVMDGASLKDKILFTSGRITSEILYKIRVAGIPMIVTKSAPTDQAVKICIENNITLLGFVRGNGMHVYGNPERIIPD